jgi:hypothetical protein
VHASGGNRAVFRACKSLAAQQILHHLRRTCTGGAGNEHVRDSNQGEARILRVCDAIEIGAAACSSPRQFNTAFRSAQPNLPGLL